MELVFDVQEKRKSKNTPKKLKNENVQLAKVLENATDAMVRGKYMELNVHFVTVIRLAKNVIAQVL
jgi:hypothetical protein